jgi:hypothetical protein
MVASWSSICLRANARASLLSVLAPYAELAYALVAEGVDE